MKDYLVIFDLDGTLLDTLGDLTDAMNFGLCELGFAARSMEECRQMIGNGFIKFCERALPDGSRDEQTIDRLRLTVKGYYDVHCLDKTAPYAGICHLIDELKARGAIMCVLTNKDQDMARRIVAGVFEDGLFDEVYGAYNGVAVKPGPEKIFELIETFGVDKSRTMMVGDSDVDIITGQNAGIMSVGVSWGLRSRAVLTDAGADKIIDDPKELLDILT